MTTSPTTGDTRSDYIFDTAWQAEMERLRALETIWDGYSQQNLDATGLAPGWRCLDVGAGGGSIARWLGERVGDQGHVVATDTDVRFLDAGTSPNLEVRRHDITIDGLESRAYDLVHTRLLLEHLRDHEAALEHMIAALKPGGWLVVEEFDHVSFLPEPQSTTQAHETWSAFLRAFERLAEQWGLDLSYGRRLLSLLTDNGLADVSCEGRSVIERGGTPGRGLLRLSVLSLRGALVATGEMDDASVSTLVALLGDPAFCWQSQVMVAAKGRKP